MNLPNYKDIKSFKFKSFIFDEEHAKAVFYYAFDDKIFFEESIFFEKAPRLDAQRLSAVYRCLKYLHLVIGISYYKAFVPENIIVETGDLTKEEADFFNKFYLSGLGEFSFKNNLNLHNKINFPYKKKTKDEEFKQDFILSDTIVIPVGGGKDSIVTIEALKKADKSPVLFSVGFPKPIADTIKISGLSNILVTRKISAQLLELNKHKEETGALNGHIPVTGVFAFILALSAIIYDFNAVAMSNERSANAENLIREDGFAVNHQWSKSFEFECLFNDFVNKHILKGFRYFSFLRPLSELYIAQLFARNRQYFDVFTSCNKAFAIVEENRIKGWCCNCDKCRFVFLALAPYLHPEKLTAIFGKNLLDDETQEQGYLELLGIFNHKPFECVGEIKESLAAFYMLSKDQNWNNSFIIKKLSKELLLNDDEMAKTIKQVLEISDNHQIPDKYMEIFNAYIRA